VIGEKHKTTTNENEMMRELSVAQLVKFFMVELAFLGSSYRLSINVHIFKIYFKI